MLFLAGALSVLLDVWLFVLGCSAVACCALYVVCCVLAVFSLPFCVCLRLFVVCCLFSFFFVMCVVCGLLIVVVVRVSCCRC